MTQKRLLFLFDFDNTIVDDNTDTYIWKLLPQREKSLPQYFAQEKQWNKFMRKVLQFYYHNDISPEQIKNCLQEMELTPGFQELFDFIRLNRQQIETAIVSDANTFFIDSILEKRNLKDVFDKIYTNPAQLIDNQEISIFPYHKNNCELPCPRNMCKSTIINQYYNLNDYEIVCYFGDGKNDYCPGTQLRKQDIIFIRKDFSLEKLVQQKGLKCKQIIFQTGIDCLQQLQTILK